MDDVKGGPPAPAKPGDAHERLERALRERIVERPHYPLGEFDADKWAAEFMRLWGHRLSEVDHGLMLAWFAGAIMTGHDSPQAEARGYARGLEAAAKEVMLRGGPAYEIAARIRALASETEGG